MLKRKKHVKGYLFGFLVTAVTLYLVTLPSNASYHAPGSMNTGHEKLACADCHKKAKGTLRQQLQVNSRFVVGLAPEPVTVSFHPVGNSVCVGCHERPDDDHAVYQFNEPKYSTCLP